MVKHEKILNYIENLQQKDEKLAKPSDWAIKICKILLVLLTIFTIGINLIYVIGFSDWLSRGVYLIETHLTRGELILDVIISLAASVGLITAVVLIFKKKTNISAIIIAGIAICFGIFRYISIRDVVPVEVGAHYVRFFWRHGLPLGAMVLICVVILLIYLGKLRTKAAAYKEIETRLYEDYRQQVELSSEDGWREYLENVDVAKAIKPKAKPKRRISAR